MTRADHARHQQDAVEWGSRDDWNPAPGSRRGRSRWPRASNWSRAADEIEKRRARSIAAYRRSKLHERCSPGSVRGSANDFRRSDAGARRRRCRSPDVVRHRRSRRRRAERGLVRRGCVVPVRRRRTRRWIELLDRACTPSTPQVRGELLGRGVLRADRGQLDAGRAHQRGHGDLGGVRAGAHESDAEGSHVMRLS